MEAHVIPFPTGAQRAAEGDHLPDPFALLFPDSIQSIAELRAELRRLPGASRPTDLSLTQRSMRAALRILDRTGAALSVGGTDAHPILGATYRGTGSRTKAASSAQLAAEAVRKASGGRLIVSGGVAEGWEGRTMEGERAILGDPGEVAAHLVDRAAPGQVLLGGDGWTTIERIRMLPAQGSLTDPVPVYVLRDVR